MMNFSARLNEPIGGPGSKFIWAEALYLPTWRIYVMPPDSIIEANLEMTAERMNLIRAFLKRPVIVTSWYRPVTYNEEIGGARGSAHMSGLACDFLVRGISSSELRQTLQPKLKEFNVRMENLNTPHVHIDLICAPDLSNEERFFKP